MLTQERLKELLHYDPDTGIFTWIKATGPRCKIGNVAGSIQTFGYRQIKLNTINYCAHKLAWFYFYGELHNGEFDHINRIKDDNRIVNLRKATRSNNTQNVPIRKDNKSGYKGVSWNGYKKRWIAQIFINGKQKQIKASKNIEDAIKARDEFVKKHYDHDFYTPR